MPNREAPSGLLHRAAIAVVWVGAPLLLAAFPACKKQKNLRGDEQVKVVVAQDKQLAKQEASLLTRRGTLQRERAHIRDKRAELINKKMTLSDDDTQGQQELSREESELVRLEAGLVKQEVTLNKKLQSLLEKKSDLVGALTDDATKAMIIARREHTISVREKDVARRESDIARRERLLSEREQSFAVRQARVCPRPTTVVTMAAPSGAPERNATRRQVEPVYRAALREMKTKGILTVDLPSGIDRLITETRHAVAKKDFTRAKFAADQLLASVRSIRIDRAFIGAKISRLSKRMRNIKLAGDRRSNVDALFRKATASYGDGRFREANRQLNRIYSLFR